MKNGKAMGPDGIPVEVWKSFGRRTGRYVIESAPEDFRAGENAVSRRNGIKLIESCYLSRVFSCL